MLAHHPITGKEIRILKTETHLYKSRKTMLWLKDAPDSANAHKFQRFDTAVFSTQSADAYKPYLGRFPSAIVLREPSAATTAWLQTTAPKTLELLFLSKAVMEAYGGPDKFVQEKFVNVICLEEMGEMYPQILGKVEDSWTDSDIFLAVSIVFRASRALNVEPTLYAATLQSAYSLEVGPWQLPEPLWLIQQYYAPPKTKRAKEINRALQENLKNPCVDHILLLNEADMTSSLPQSDKLQQIVIGHRLTYADVFAAIQQQIPSNAIVAFANSDIALTESWLTLWSVNLKNTFLSLLRYENPEEPNAEPQLFGPRPDSQDTWVVRAEDIQGRTLNADALAFPFGKAGCDNAINVEMLKLKFVVANPALTLKTIHYHRSQVRTYDPKDVVDKPFYMYLDPTGLHDLEPKQDLKAFQQTLPSPQEFSRRIQSTSEKDLKTFCSMAATFEFSADSNNVFQCPKTNESLYTFKNSFVTPNGLVYGYKSIFMSQQPHLREAWATTRISPVTPCMGVKAALAAPLSDATSADALTYLTTYLSRILRLKSANYKGDFWLPRTTPRLQEFLQQFQWEEQVMPVLPRDEQIAAFAEDVTWLTPRATELPYKEDMDALRNKLRGYERQVRDTKRVVLAQDDTVISENDINELEAVLEAHNYNVDVIYPSRSSPRYFLQRLLGASALIGYRVSNLYWMLPEGAKVLDFMSELDIKGDAAHMAGACGLHYWITLLPRAKKEHLLPILIDRSLKALAAESQKPAPILPRVYVPSGHQPGDTFYHSGDTFREMVDIWAEKGWVTKVLAPGQSHCRWGTLDGPVLYDRPTYKWLEMSPVSSTTKIIYGNPLAKGTNGVQWSFWPRHPKLLEAQVEKGLVPWEERTKGMVFYGRIENAVQNQRRSNGLLEACEDYDCPQGATAPYKYTQTQYLEQLSKAKYGLCLAGYGSKCNREMECMALGTVPVCAPDVDMKGYAVPPVAGVHYIQLKSFDAEEARLTVEAIPVEHWRKMSVAAHQWWKENASAAGLFALTKTILASL
jgi:hypothetical protein